MPPSSSKPSPPTTPSPSRGSPATSRPSSATSSPSSRPAPSSGLPSLFPAGPPVNLSGVWLLEPSMSDSLVPLYDYHHIPYSPLTVDKDLQLMHIEHHSDRLISHHYTLPASTALSSFSLSSPPPSYSVSYPISSFSAPSQFLPIRLPHRTTTARCYQAPHLQSLIVDTYCQSKYDLERREVFLLPPTAAQAPGAPLLVEEIRVLTCDPTVPVMGRKGPGVATPFKAGMEEKEVIAKNKAVVQELLMIKRAWRKVEVRKGGRGVTAALSDSTPAAAINGLTKDASRDALKDKARDAEKERRESRPSADKGGKRSLSGVAEEGEDASGAAVKRPLAPLITTQPSSSAPPPPALVSPTSPVLTSASPADFSGVYVLNLSASRTLSAGIRFPPLVPGASALPSSTAFQRRQALKGIKGAPVGLHPPTLCELLVLSVVQRSLASSYFLFRRWPGTPLAAYGAKSFMRVPDELMEAQGRRRVGHGDVRHVSGGVMTVEDEERAEAEGWVREKSELRRTERGLELLCTKEIDGAEVHRLTAVYERIDGLAPMEEEVRLAQTRMRDAIASAPTAPPPGEATPPSPKEEALSATTAVQKLPEAVKPSAAADAAGESARAKETAPSTAEPVAAPAGAPSGSATIVAVKQPPEPAVAMQSPIVASPSAQEEKDLHRAPGERAALASEEERLAPEAGGEEQTATAVRRGQAKWVVLLKRNRVALMIAVVAVLLLWVAPKLRREWET